ncbi:MAG: hypothetical protein JWM53_3031, partial [bacterium]|nr:hypothetical protein [bacterium]
MLRGNFKQLNPSEPIRSLPSENR